MNIEGLDLHDALLERVALDASRELRLHVFVPEAAATATMGSREQHGRRLVIRFGAISNYANVERFFFGGPLSGSERALDEVADFKQTRAGWSLELARRGRVAIKTTKRPTIECNEEAG